MMEVKISIIVPVYNTERLLPRCINSILSQSFRDFELILVNDGSTDKSGEICDCFSKRDRRIIVIHKENGGSSTARNTGLVVAKGDYIGFVDSDDYINKYMYEILYKNATNYFSDIVICSYEDIYDDQYCTSYKFEDNKEVQHFNNIDALKQMYMSKTKYITYVVPWNKLYKRNLFGGIKYEVGNMYDDETVAHKLLYNSHKITFINSNLYYYVQRKGSQMNSPFHIKKLDKVYALKNREIYFRKMKVAELHQKALKHYMEMFFWNYFLARSKLKNIETELIKLKRTFDESLIHLLRHRGLSLKQKLMCVLFCLSPPLYEFMRDIKSK